MSDRIQLEAIPGMPRINEGDDVGEVIVSAAQAAGLEFRDRDILCVASKAVSIAEGKTQALSEVEVSDTAKQMHAKLPRKDPRTIQVIINETGAPDGSRIDLGDNYIGGWLPNGLHLTSSGVDKAGPEAVILLPEDADSSAGAIGRTILQATGVNVGVIITDSDGRVDKRGANQIAIGVYGVPPLRITESPDETGELKTSEETVCDMLAASAGLIMGQRGTNQPAVIIRGFEYQFDQTSSIQDAINDRAGL